MTNKNLPYEIGDFVSIFEMVGEPQYTGATGVITHIDDAGQIHGTWGGCALIPEKDNFSVLHSNNKGENTMKITITQEITSKTKDEFYAQLKDGRIVRIWEGTGDNLFDEDVEAGYVDYINYEIYNNIKAIYDNDYYDGGMILLKQLYQDLSVKEILDFVSKDLSEEFVGC